MAILEIILPLFLIVLAGYLTAHAQIIKPSDVDALTRFIFSIALPVLLFDSLAHLDHSQRIDFRFMLIYYLALLVIYGLGMFLFGRFFHVPKSEQGIFGMGASYSNLILVGLPVISAGLGDQALLPLFMLVSVHGALQFFLTSVLMERGDPQGRSLRRIATRTANRLLRNPIIIGIAVGLSWNLLALPLPAPLESAIELMSAAALPTSLFVLGAALTTFKVAGHFSEAGVIIALKLIIQPVLVWFLAFIVFKVDPLWASVAVLAAGMPVGVNVYIFAQHYRFGTAVLSTAVLLSTILAIFSQSIWLMLLT